MKKNYTNKAELCYKDVCAKFYDEKANILLVVVALAVLVVAASAASKTLN